MKSDLQYLFRYAPSGQWNRRVAAVALQSADESTDAAFGGLERLKKMGAAQIKTSTYLLPDEPTQYE